MHGNSKSDNVEASLIAIRPRLEGLVPVVQILLLSSGYNLMQRIIVKDSY